MNSLADFKPVLCEAVDRLNALIADMIAQGCKVEVSTNATHDRVIVRVTRVVTQAIETTSK